MPADPMHRATAAAHRARSPAAATRCATPTGRPGDGRSTGRAQPGVAKPDPILVADEVTASFGGLTAVDVEHLEIQRGAITALIGPNGAGKTTFFNLLTGFDKPDAGHLDLQRHARSTGVPGLQGRPARHGPHLPADQGARLLTVIENMRLGATASAARAVRGPRSPLWRAQERAITERADELLARFKLDDKRDDFAGSLSGGQRKLLEMARALMAEPQLVMLDEPMAGVNPALTQSLLGHVKRPAGRGHDRAVRRARHGHGARHRRLGGRHGRGRDHRRRARPTVMRDQRGDRRLPRSRTTALTEETSAGMSRAPPSSMRRAPRATPGGGGDRHAAGNEAPRPQPDRRRGRAGHGDRRRAGR